MENLKLNGSNWIIKEDSVDPDVIKRNETLFSLSNGHFGTRGSLEESFLYSDNDFGYNDSTLVNGFYDSDPIKYGEWAYGYAEYNQTIIPLPHTKHISIEVEKDMFSLNEGIIHKHTRELNLKTGILTRNIKWESPKGHLIEATFERFVSYTYPEILAQAFTITSINEDLEVNINFNLDDLGEINQTEKQKDFDPRVKKNNSRRFITQDIDITKDKNYLIDNLMHIKTKNSNLNLLIGQTTKCSNQSFHKSKKHHTISFKGLLKKGHPTHFEQFTGYSIPFNNLHECHTIKEHLISQLTFVKSSDYKFVKDQHLKDMSVFWSKADIEIEGDNLLQLGLRFNLFHLNQAAARDGVRNISAKGLTGEGYEGHYFWDTEIYMLPFFIFTQPNIAKNLLLFRYNILDQARDRARIMGIDEGALFAWRTINGEEASAYYPAGTAQIHINGAISNAIRMYVETTEDNKFKWENGLEIVIEIARFYFNWGHFDTMRNGAFVLNSVTGPDEYTAIVNNNYYTNLIAKNAFKLAYDWVLEAKKDNNKQAIKIFKKVCLKDDEWEKWKKASDHMYLPYDDNTQLSMQDDSFFSKEVWDFKNTPQENYPLLLNYHPLTIYKHQVNKQADLILAHFLFPNSFTTEQIAKDYDYYESITTHDSSLSRSIFSIVASRLNRTDKAYDYFMDTVLMDLTDMQNNTKDGVHAANMGGSWMSTVIGFGGMRTSEDTLSFSPQIPVQWNKLKFRIEYKKRNIEVKITKENTSYTLLKGKPIELTHYSEKKLLENQLIF